jgi:hypothetical protein
MCIIKCPFITAFRPLRLLIVDVVSLLGFLHCVVAGDVSDVLEVRAGGGVSV